MESKTSTDRSSIRRTALWFWLKLNPTKGMFSKRRPVQMAAHLWMPWWGKVGYWLND